jgi:hypothetical protein
MLMGSRVQDTIMNTLLSLSLVTDLLESSLARSKKRVRLQFHFSPDQNHNHLTRTRSESDLGFSVSGTCSIHLGRCLLATKRLRPRKLPKSNQINS